MILQIFLGTISGLIAGMVTGVIPGVHMNLVATLLTFQAASLTGKPDLFVPFLIALSIAYCFFEYIPALFLSTPEDSSALLVKPTHKFIKSGRGLEALKIVTKSSLMSIGVFILALPLLFYLLPLSYKVIGNYSWIFLVAISIHLILKEREPQKVIWASFVFLTAGTLGYIVLNSKVSFKLMPLLTGIFGVPFLLRSLKNENEIPNQLGNVATGLGTKEMFLGSFSGLIATFLLGLFPGLGPAQASMLSNEVKDEKGPRDFLVSMGAININDILFSVLALFTIGKPRAGTINTIKNLFGFSKSYFIISIPIAIVVAVLAYFLTNEIGKRLLDRIQTLNSNKVILSILGFLLTLTFLLNGFYGILILISGSLIGYLALKKGVRQSHGMAALIVPIVIYFLG